MMELDGDVVHTHDPDTDSYLASPHVAASDTGHLSNSTRTYTKDANPDVEQAPISPDTLLTPLESCSGVRSSHSTPFLVSVWKWVLVFFVPTISFAYLTFCYVVHYRVVPANVPGLSADMTQLITSLGAGVTTVNIVIISLALFPLRGLLNELQSEEFFRLLSAEKNRDGVKLAAINGISSPSYSLVDSIMVIVYRYCSSCYVMAFVAAIVIWAISILAPAALSTQPIIVDGAIMAFSVGAIPPLSLYQPVAGGQTVQPSLFSPPPGYSAAIVWAEREIGLSYSFSVLNDSQGAFAGFVVPTPPLLNSTTNARWLTDVIGFNPYCTWANPVNLTSASLNVTMNSTKVPDTAVSVHLQDIDLRVSVPSSYFPVYDSFFVTSMNVHDPTVTIFNYTTDSLSTDGAMVMSVVQCASTNCTKEAIDIISLFVDFTGIPSMTFSSVGADYELGFLVCKPNMTIETREVRTQGSMTLEVRPLAEGSSTANAGGAASPSPSPYPRQDNLDWTQTSLLVSYSLSALTADSGPLSSAWNGLGSGTQVDFVFGGEQMASVPSGLVYENTSMVLRPLPADQLAEGYTQMVKASMKPYVSGVLGTSYVPGRLASVEQIFVSSLPHVVASTVLFFMLFAMAVAAHFRCNRGEIFNLTNIAVVLADSVNICEGTGKGTSMGLATMVKKEKLGVIMEREGREIRRKGSGRKAGISEKLLQSCRWVTTPGRGHRNGDVDVGQEVARRLGDYKVYLEHPAEADGLEVLSMSISGPSSRCTTTSWTQK